MISQSMIVKAMVSVLTIALSTQASALMPGVSNADLQGDDNSAQIIDVKSGGGSSSFGGGSHSSYSNGGSSSHSYGGSSSSFGSSSHSSSSFGSSRSESVSRPSRSESPSIVTRPSRSESSPFRSGGEATRTESKPVERARDTDTGRFIKRDTAPSVGTTTRQTETTKSTTTTETKRSGWFSGFGRSKADSTPTAPVAKTSPRDSSGSSVQAPAARTTLNTRQGGIAGTSKNLDNVQAKFGKNMYEGTDASGAKVRFKRDPVTGQDRITSRVTVDKSGAKIKANYDESGRKTAFEKRTSSGDVIKSSIHKDGTSHTVLKTASGDRIISDSRRGGYVEHTYRNSSGQVIQQRNYYNKVTNRTYVRNYYTDSSGYRYYSPSYSFAAGFYTGFMFGSVWSPYSPVFYPYYSGWNWYPQPWIFNPYNPYSYYFVPYVNYVSPIDWVADYVIADTLAEAFQSDSRQAEMQQQIDHLQDQVQDLQNNSARTQTVVMERAQSALIDEATKKQISLQVKEEIAAQQAQSSVPMTKVLADPKYLFLVSDELDASFTNAQGQPQECTLEEGDIFQLTTPISGADQKVAEIRVKTAKKSDSNCKAGTVVNVSVSDLQDMKNDMSARVEEGSKKAHDQQGKNGIPSVDQSQVVSKIASPTDSTQVKMQLDQAAQKAQQEAQSFDAAP